MSILAKDNPEKMRGYRKKWELKNPERRAAYLKKWRAMPENKERQRLAMAQWRKDNPERNREIWKASRERNRDERNLADRLRRLNNKGTRLEKRRGAYRQKRTDPAFRIECSLRSRLIVAVRGIANKAASTKELLGCSREHLLAWLQFWMKPGMTWENYGEWHIDHKKPCASFDLTKPDEQRKCFHYTNLEPLWAADNFSKGAKYVV